MYYSCKSSFTFLGVVFESLIKNQIKTPIAEIPRPEMDSHG
jgi:hypothetical protein